MKVRIILDIQPEDLVNETTTNLEKLIELMTDYSLNGIKHSQVLEDYKDRLQEEKERIAQCVIENLIRANPSELNLVNE